MQPLAFRKILLAAVIGGIAAGLLAGVFHLLLTEPVIERAIAIEERPLDAHGQQQIISRQAQKFGLLAGLALYGLGWGLLLTVFYHPLQARITTLTTRKGSLLAIALLYWSLALVPFIKYPANPPGVGEPTTIEYRQQLYLALLLLSLASTAVTVFAGRQLAWRLRLRRRWTPCVGGLVLSAACLYLFMPTNPDQVRVPRELVQHFRLLSLTGLTLFWATFALCFTWLAHRRAGAAPHGR